MRRILTVALILYNFIALATRAASYDYEDLDGNKRHSLMDDRRTWRKKTLQKPLEEHKDWDRWRRDYDNQRYMDDQEPKFNAGDRQRERDLDISAPYRGGDRGGDRIRDRGRDIGGDVGGDRGGNRGGGVNRNRYENDNNLQQPKSAEREGHSAPYNNIIEKEPEKKLTMNCERPHERYEACFAGCASVTCDNPRDRLRPCYPFCEPGCICTPPYVRDDRTHKCVLPEECTRGLKGIPDLGDEI